MSIWTCADCGKECSPITVDDGFGPYEHGVHHDFHDVSSCCEAELIECFEKIVRRAVHVARKNYGNGIKVGDRYLLVVTRHWRKNGPGWITTEKLPIFG